MAQKIRIGFVYSNNTNWIGGTYYIENLIKSFIVNERSFDFELIVLSNSKEDFKRLRQQCKPLRLLYKNPNRTARTIPGRFVNKIWAKILHKAPIIDNRLNDKDLDLLFPATDSIVFEKVTNKCYWIPDFQEYYYPDFFSNEELNARKQFHQQISKKNTILIVSSHNAKNDFLKFYPNAICKVNVVNFAVTLPKLDNTGLKELLKKYNIEKEYFMCPNQFWQHKNHLTLIKAIKCIKDQGQNVLVVFTGKEHDHRNPDYFNNLKKFVKDQDIEDNVRFLGFIDRNEQLKLMENAKAIIQPSLFEGWSTVVEDTKALNQHIIVSDIPVHREQLNADSLFFNPMDEIDLMNKILSFQTQRFLRLNKDYTINIRNFCNAFLIAINN